MASRILLSIDRCITSLDSYEIDPFDGSTADYMYFSSCFFVLCVSRGREGGDVSEQIEQRGVIMSSRP